MYFLGSTRSLKDSLTVTHLLQYLKQVTKDTNPLLRAEQQFGVYCGLAIAGIICFCDMLH